MPQHKFKPGEIVIDRIRPAQKLIVQQILDHVYYCKLEEAPNRKAIVYLERDLMADMSSAIK